MLSSCLVVGLSQRTDRNLKRPCCDYQTQLYDSGTNSCYGSRQTLTSQSDCVLRLMRIAHDISLIRHNTYAVRGCRQSLPFVGYDNA